MNLIPAKKDVFRLVLDEPVAHLGNLDGTVVIRGEVIVNFSKDTAIQGAIKLIFEGIQRYYPWREIMEKSTSGKPIETKIHVIELSLLPPNSRGIMPAGIQRFPFEFPLSGALPITLSIPDRLDIFYRLTATLQRPTEDDAQPGWLDWTRFGKRQHLFATADLRLVRAIEPIPSLTPPHQTGANTRPSTTHDALSLSSHQPANPRIQAPDQVSATDHRRTSLDRYYAIEQHDDRIHSALNNQVHLGLALDEQHDRLAYSMAGRTVDNWCKPVSELEYGVRYRLGIDRTAIAIGTSVGVDVLLEPLTENIKIRSIVTRISETRDFTMEIPSGVLGKNSRPEVRKYTETSAMVLKWAYGYPTEHDEISSSSSDLSIDHKSNLRKKSAKHTSLNHRYRHRRRHWSEDLYNENNNGTSSSGSRHSNFGLKGSQSRADVLSACEDIPVRENYGDDVAQSKEADATDKGELLNLKLLNETVQVGEYFEGRFVMPVPTCDHSLRPTVSSGSISIIHWLHLIVVIEANGKAFKVTLGTPVRLLDCRLVAADDERQTILPPPPSYDTSEANITSSTASNTTEFWAQRWPITQDAVWGTYNRCPCQIKQLLKDKKSISKGNQISQKIPALDAPPRYSDI
ncbi:hypothetical protein BX666DRAFT_1934741 [Dichotomocladium elegans]|nr:hypothetical protein BX666DRAFT_1934741 [Dichotomocladium elegans]